MSQSNSTDRKPAGIKSGLATAITLFILSIFLHFRSDYFGILTNAISIAFIVIGFIGMGFDLNKLATKQGDLSDEHGHGTGIFDNIGPGLGLLVLWSALYYYSPTIWVRVPIFLILLFGVYAILLGLINYLVDFVLSKQDIEAQRISIEAKHSDDKEALLRLNASKSFLAIKNIFIAMGLIVGIVAGVLQSLQILKFIP